MAKMIPLSGRFLAKIGLLVIIDFLLLSLTVYLMEPGPGDKMVAFIILPVLIVLNVLVGFILRIWSKQWAMGLFFNTVISAGMFISLFDFSIHLHLGSR